MSEQSKSFFSVMLQCLVYATERPETANLSVGDTVGISSFNQFWTKMQVCVLQKTKTCFRQVFRQLTAPYVMLFSVGNNSSV